MATNYPPEKRAELRRTAWDLAVEGRTHRAIADELGVSQSQVSRYLAVARKAAWEGLVEEARTYAVLSLRQSDRVIWEALQAFDRSKKPRKRATRRTSSDGTATGEGTGQTTTEVTEREGEPAWLAEVRAGIGLRLAILARFAPPETERPDAAASGPTDLARALTEAEARDAAYPTAEAPIPCDDSPPSSA